ncbi:MAG: ATP-binding protein [Nocardioides sp.]
MIGEAAREHRRLEPHPSSVAEARRLVREVLGDHPQGDWLERAQLCVSELVTNAVVHAGTPVDVHVLVHGGGVRVEVLDHSPHLPIPRRYASLAGTGRGLMMVDQSCERWGVLTNDDGKTVWFELGAPADLGLDPELSSTDGVRRPTVSVVLHNVPLLLHSAWRMHAETLLREYLLSRLDENLDHLEAHAAASEAIAVLQEQVPVPEVGDDPDGIMAAATEPFVSREQLEIEVPLASLPNFEMLDLLLESAVTLADAGRLMTPGTQPEIRAFRRWLCGEVTRQAQGNAPTPWDPDAAHPVESPSEPLPWDPGVVSHADTAVLAADDANRIVAVSPAAVALLVYGSEPELVGKRLVDIVPFRFRQAHLAGFTLHMFAGRAALIGVPVQVPILCADGRELLVELTVHSQPLPRGRHVFTADLRVPEPT